MRYIWLLAIVGLGLCAQAQVKDEIWNALPKCQKVQINVGYDLRIQAFLLNCETWRIVLGDPAADCTNVENLQKLVGRPILVVYVWNISDKGVPYSALNFAFTQSAKQWDVTLSDVASASGNFLYCFLRPLAILVGYLALPKDLDITKPFRLWYKDAFGTVGCPSD
ncbi:MAG: hypothetical protein QW067_12420 [Thermofilaceae archaeon]